MQVNKQRSSEDPPPEDMKKKPSCFSNIKIFLVAECALMLAQGTVGAYLVSEAMVSFCVWIRFTLHALRVNDCLFLLNLLNLFGSFGLR